jgi:phospholipid/cholesterol/gamma-HCH transport system ATP-binding protein
VPLKIPQGEWDFSLSRASEGPHCVTTRPSRLARLPHDTYVGQPEVSSRRHPIEVPARHGELALDDRAQGTMYLEDLTSASRAPTPDVPAVAPAVLFDRVSIAFDGQVVLRDISFSVPTGSMTILLGASGAGKSVILKLILGLLRPDSGAIYVNGQSIGTMTEPDLMRVRAGIGMLFQEHALFDSLNVADNVGYRLFEGAAMPEDQVRERVDEVLGFVGLRDYGDRMPAELSGGERRRVAIARAMAAQPGILLFDDPTCGLDPITATTVDDEVVKLRDVEHVTSILVTHQIRDAFYVATHEAVRQGGRVRISGIPVEKATRATFLVLHEGRICFEGTAMELQASRDAYLREFLFMTLPPW